MKMKKSNSYPWFLAMALVICLSSTSHAATIPVSWDGGNGAWGDSNWNGGGTSPGFTFGNTDPTPNITISSGDTVDATASTLIVQNNDTDITSITIDGGSTLNVNDLRLEGGGSQLEVVDGNIVFDGIFFPTVGSGGAGGELQLTKGLLTFNAAHPFRTTGVGFEEADQVNFIGAAGDASVLLTNLSDSRDIIHRAVRGFFSIDGTVIDPVADGSDIGALNAELETLAVGGRFLFIDTTVSGQQTLELLAVPEPASFALFTVALLYGASIRRK